MRSNNPSGGELKGSEQRRRFMTLVIVALAAHGTAAGQLQTALRPLESLNRMLFIDAENNRLGGRVQVKADVTGSFRRKIGIVTLALGSACREVDLSVACVLIGLLPGRGLSFSASSPWSA